MIEEGEHQQLDFKFAISDSKKIARSLAAFANTDGGKLLIGVKDNGSIAGAIADEEFYMVQAAAEMYCKPPVKYSYKSWNIKGKIVLEIDVKPSVKKPHKAVHENGKWLTYIRVKDENIVANNVLLEVWRRQKSKQATVIKYTEVEKKLLEVLEKKKKIKINDFCREAVIPQKKAEKILVDMILTGIINIDFVKQDVFYSLSEE